MHHVSISREQGFDSHQSHPPCRVRVFPQGDDLVADLVGVDEVQGVASFYIVGVGTTAVPRAYVKAVWQELRDPMWRVKVAGRIFPSPEHAFIPEEGEG
jgi:hypothetical protein